MTLDEQIAAAEAEHLRASRDSDAADEAWGAEEDTLFFSPGVLERQAEASNERLRTFEVLHDLKFRKACGLP